MSTHLSVDLDYWQSYSTKPDSLSYFKKILSLNKPITIYTQHQNILRKLKGNYDKVINIDYHSDISEPIKGWANCGIWANFVKNRNNAEFNWRYPNYSKCIKSGLGLCHLGHIDGSKFDPFINNKLHSWKLISRKEGLAKINYKDVEDISVILSIDYSVTTVIGPTLKLIKELKEQNRIEFYGRNVIKQLDKMIYRSEKFASKV